MIIYDNDAIRWPPPQKVDHFSQKIQLNSRTKFVISSYTNVSPMFPLFYLRVLTNSYMLASGWHSCSCERFRTNSRVEIFPAVN